MIHLAITEIAPYPAAVMAVGAHRMPDGGMHVLLDTILKLNAHTHLLDDNLLKTCKTMSVTLK